METCIACKNEEVVHAFSLQIMFLVFTVFFYNGSFCSDSLTVQNLVISFIGNVS